MLRLINLKQDGYTVDYALKILEIEIEGAKREGLVAIKVLHGYGSHGKGGVILAELRKLLPVWKRNGFIKNYFGGEKWDLFDKDAQEILNKDKSISGDCDMGIANPGITIIQIN